MQPNSPPSPPPPPPGDSHLYSTEGHQQQDNVEVTRVLDDYFDDAVNVVQSLPGSGPIQSSYDEKLTLYSLYKQATEGNITIPRPGLLDMLGRAKWDAWAKQRDVSQEDAKGKYIEIVLGIMGKYPEDPDAREYEDRLGGYLGAQTFDENEMGGRIRGRGRRGEQGARMGRRGSSSSSAGSFVSSRQSPLSDDRSHLEGGDEGYHHVNNHNRRVPTGIEFINMNHAANDRPGQSPSPLASAFLPPAQPVEGHLKRRNSDSSISLGGDAQSHHASRAGSMIASRAGSTRSKRRRGSTARRGRAVGGAAAAISQIPSEMTLGSRLGQVDHLPVGLSLSQPGSNQPLHFPLLPGFTYQNTLTGSLPSRLRHQPNPQFSSGSHLHSQSAQHVPMAQSPAPSMTFATSQFSAPVASPFMTAARLRERLHNQSPGPSSSSPAVGPPTAPHMAANAAAAAATGLAGVNLPLALEQIQTSLTALLERIIALEHAQGYLLLQPADPWTTLLRWFSNVTSSSGGSSRGHDDEYEYDPSTYAPPGMVRDDLYHGTHGNGQNGSGSLRNSARHKRQKLPLRILFRLLGTIRRAMVDIMFVLVVMSLGAAVWAGIKGRGRGGRRAMVAFWGNTLRRGRLMYRNAFDRLIEQ